MHYCHRALLLTLALLAQSTLRAADPPAAQDYSALLPRIPPKTPDEALKAFVVRPGFRVELVAAEPLIKSPVAIDFDEDGRMFVVEFTEYNQYANSKPHGRGAVRRLEDTDGDGRFDKSTPYAEGIDLATAVGCWDGGVFVGASPDIWYCKDTQGNGKADLRRQLFTGFGRDHAGEGMINSFRWGFDNRYHVSTSIDGGDVRPIQPKDARAISVRSQNLLIDPRAGTMEPTSGGMQHGLSLDDWGRAFVCSNSDPIHLIMYDRRYVARNPFLEPPAPAVNIAPAGKYTRLFRVSSIEPWRALRTRLRSQGAVPGPDEGGQASGFFTGATGVTIYRGDSWPAEFRGNAFVGEVSGNLVHRARLEPDGLGLIAQRADPGMEFLASRDNWFRPVQFANAPDGTLYVVDMYRELIEGAAFLPPAILKHLDVGSGVDRGRIWRIVPDAFKQPKPPRLSRASSAELVALLEHANGWHRDTASRLLYQRQDPMAVEPLRQLAQHSRSSLGRMHALYALQGLSALKAADVIEALADQEPQVREQAVRLAEAFGTEPAVRSRLLPMTEDGDARVRYQLAFSLGAVPGAEAGRALVKLALRDAANSWVRLAILSSISDRSSAIFDQLLADQAFRASGHGRILLTTLAGQVGAAGRKDDVTALIRSLDGLGASDKALLSDIVRALATRLPTSARAQLTTGKAGELFAGLLRDAQATALQEKSKVPERVAAVRTLGLAAFADVTSLFAELLQSRQPPQVQAAALETLARFDQAGVAPLLLGAWPGLSPALRATATETLFSRPAWISAFLDAVEKGQVSRGDVDPARVQLLQKSTDDKIRTRAVRLFAGTTLARRQDVVTAYAKALQIKGDVARGKAKFKQVCSACHRLENVGESIGADLSAIRDRGSEAILLNILDPNREVKPQFVSYVVVTDTGRLLTGMITAETANTITLRKPDGTNETVLRSNVEEMRSTGLSFMPEGLEKQVDVPAMADLIAYLNSIK
jgi:putative membrane-bound dehydrogenase-like protein